LESIMVSPTQQTETVRRRKERKRAKAHQMALKRRPTPVFPVHPEGYDPKAPDAQPTAETTKE